MRLRVISVLIVSILARLAHAVPSSFTWEVNELQSACTGAFFANVPIGQLGLPVEGKLKPDYVYQWLDPRVGKVVYVLTDSEGRIDPRPLGRNTVLECRQVGIEVEQGYSRWCILQDGRFGGLKQGHRMAKHTILYQFTELLRPDWRRKQAFHWLEWMRTEDKPFLLRNQKSVVNTTPRKLANTKAYRPGETTGKFYRTEEEYWQNLYGKNYAVPVGMWMQLFADGNYYLVEKDYHLEYWPTEKNVLVKVPDDEVWVKVGRGQSAYLFADPAPKKRKKIDWVHFYAAEGYLPSNPQVNAVDACTPCPKRPRVY